MLIDGVMTNLFAGQIFAAGLFSAVEVETAQALSDACEKAGVAPPFLISPPPLIVPRTVSSRIYFPKEEVLFRAAQQMAAASSATGSSGPVSHPASGTARFFLEKIKEAREGKKPVEALKAEWAKFYPEKAKILFPLLDRLCAEAPINGEEIDPVARALGVDFREVLKIVIAWQRYLAALHLVAPKQKEHGDFIEFALQLENRLQTLLKPGKKLLPVSVAPVLEPLPPVIGKTFHNRVMGTGKNEPRKEATVLTREIYAGSGHDHKRVVFWERFWERMAAQFGWELKPFLPPSPQKIGNGVAKFLKEKLEEARTERRDLVSLRKELEGVFPRRNIVIILFDRIGKTTGVRQEYVDALARDLGVTVQDASEIVTLWRQFIHDIHFVPLSPEEWGAVRSQAARRLHERLCEVAEKEGGLDPELVSQSLLTAPDGVSKTFHNLFFTAKGDFPRQSLRKLGLPVDGAHFWERFWLEEAKRWGWRVKPSKLGEFADLMAGIEYAKAAKWDLMKFHRWLENNVRQDTKKKASLFLFGQVIDLEVLKGKRKKALLRSTLPKMIKEYFGAEVNVSHYNSQFLFWIGQWEELAKACDAQAAIRPRPAHAVRLSETRRKGRTRRGLVEQAAKAEGNRAAILYRLLLEAGLKTDAATVANVCEGVRKGERLPPRRLAVGGLTIRGVEWSEAHLIPWLEEFGFPMKPLSRQSARIREGRRTGMRLAQIIRSAVRERWNVEQFRHALGADTEPSLLLAFDQWSREKSGGGKQGRNPVSRRLRNKLDQTALALGWL